MRRGAGLGLIGGRGGGRRERRCRRLCRRWRGCLMWFGCVFLVGWLCMTRWFSCKFFVDAMYIIFYLERMEKTHASLLVPRYPPNPIDIEPATISAIPPKTTTLVSSNADKPAVRANGTVMPSERPMIASDTMRPLMILDPFCSVPLSTGCEPIDSRSCP